LDSPRWFPFDVPLWVQFVESVSFNAQYVPKPEGQPQHAAIGLPLISTALETNQQPFLVLHNPMATS
jgi:hypothetical protein